jgi:nucleoid-associated protein YgaU
LSGDPIVNTLTNFDAISRFRLSEKLEYGIYRFASGYNFSEIPLDDGDIWYEVKAEDRFRLDFIANKMYGDVRLWWVIAQANPDKITNPFEDVVPGTILRMPVPSIAYGIV